MKKTTTLFSLLAFLFVFTAEAQYYYLPFENAGTNPGGLNNDGEYPVANGLPAGWVSIHGGSAASPAWSSIATIPFPFNFNGTDYTTCKVSTSGVLTFTTSASTVPSYGNTPLPTSSVPDNSICAWGISGHGTNDNIVVKTFGTAPNRQFWVMFSSYSTPATTCYVYWSIVLEESTNAFYIVDQRQGGCSLSLTLGVQINSTTAFQVFGSPNVTQLAGADPTPIDNSYYAFYAGSLPANQARLTDISATPFIVVPGSTFIEGDFLNLGSAPISGLDINYEVNGNVYTETLNSLNIPSYGSYHFIHNTPLSISVPASYDVKVWVSLAGEADPSDDTLTTTVSGLTFLPTKRVLIEEATGTWCGWCPRGTVYTDSIDKLYPGSALVVAVHNSDPMANQVYDAGMNALIGGYPSGLVDRKDLDVDPSDFITYYQDRIQDVPPADVAVSAFFNSATRQVDIEVSATFAAEISGDLRFNAILVEDDVTGTTSNYAQTNYYSFQSQNIALVGAGHNWQTEPNPVPAANVEYDFVGREILGGFEGTAGSLPSSVSANTTYTYSYSTTIPPGWDENSMRVIGVLLDAGSGQVLNANRGAYGITTAVNQIEEGNLGLSVYPNPASNFVQVEISLKQAARIQVELFDAASRRVINRSLELSEGKNAVPLSLSGMQKGMYMLRILSDEGTSLSRRIVVQ